MEDTLVRRLIGFCLSLLLCMSAFSASAVILPEEPTRYYFSIGNETVQEAVARGEAVEFSAQLAVNETSLLPDVAQETIQSLMGTLSLQGVVKAKENGGGMDLALLAGGVPVGEASQRVEGEHVTLSCAETALCATAEEFSAVSALSEILASVEYGDLTRREQPLLALVKKEVKTLWGLASPFVDDNNYLSVSSGATSHGITYKIDNDAFHQIVEEWAGQLSQEIPQVLRDKILDFAQNAELRNTMKFNLTYGEGDVLRSARGSGTIRYQGSSAGFSFRYSASVSSTRVTRSWRITYEPAKSDTMVFNLTTLSSSSGNGRAAEEVDMSMSGQWDGHTYRVRFKTDFLNRYEKTEEGLTELLTGSLSASLKYAGNVLVEIKAKRNGNTICQNREAQTVDTWTGTISSGEEVWLDGALTLTMQTDGQDLKENLPVPMAISVQDEDAFAQARALWRQEESSVRQNLLNALDEQTMALLYNAY